MNYMKKDMAKEMEKEMKRRKRLYNTFKKAVLYGFKDYHEEEKK